VSSLRRRTEIHKTGDSLDMEKKRVRKSTRAEIRELIELIKSRLPKQ